MGQYYNVVTMDEAGVIKAYDRHVDGEYTPAKLMEHSWWFNEFVSTITKMLYHNPMRIAWVGDYSEDEDYLEQKELELFNLELFEKFFDAAWGEENDDKLLGVKKDMLSLDGKFLVNHTYKTYVDCDEYLRLSRPSDVEDWIIHPLPLLTCIGNGLGGGDYYGVDEEGDVGFWAMCEVSVEDEAPAGYEKQSGLYFTEEVLTRVIEDCMEEEA